MSPVPTLSYSSVRAFLECPLRWKFLYIDKLPETPRGYFSFGRTVHAALEEFVRPLVVPLPRRPMVGQTQRTLDAFGTPGNPRPEAPGRSMNREELLAAYARLWISEGYGSPEEEQRYRSLGADLLGRYYDGFVAAPPRPVAVEDHLQTTWGGIPVHGYIDRIDRTEAGGLEVLDYKTTRGLSHQDAKGSDQLSFYQVLVESNYPLAVESLALFDLRGGSALRVPGRRPAELHPVYDQVATTSDGIRAEAFEPTPGRHCGRCEFQSRCPEFREVPPAEKERLADLVDRFAALRQDEVRLDADLRRVANELHREAERLGVHRVSGRNALAVRRRDEKWSFPPEAVRPTLEEASLTSRASAVDGALVQKLLKDPAIDPEVRRKLSERGARTVRWSWDLDSAPESTERPG